MEEPSHVPVMLEEILDFLPLRPGILAIDGTLGLAGHSLQVAKRISPGGVLVATDWDRNMLRMAESKLKDVGGVELSLHHADFRRLPEIVRREYPARLAGAIILDLGLCNVQIEDPSRGISFKSDGPLDMRFDTSKGKPLSDLIHRMSAEEIAFVLKELGGENWAKRISEVIVDRRKVKKIETTSDLVDCVMAAIPPSKRDRRIHPATRTFQAFRIYVNDELDELQETVCQIASLLDEQGVMVVESYHSGEDRPVKFAFKKLLEQGGFELVTKKPLVPTQPEVQSNPKSRSAKLRVIRRTSFQEEGSGHRPS